MDDFLNLPAGSPLALDSLVVNLLLSVLLASAVAWFYTQYGRSFSNRAKFANNLPALAMATVLIISVVKSSLALSLGLVGALSIVRFRTAIKEPEELIYLFIAIAIGLGLGADQRWPTLVAIALILLYLYLRTLFTARPPRNNLYFNLSTADGNVTFTHINDILLRHLPAVELRRVDSQDHTLQTSYLVQVPNDRALVALMDDLRANLPGCEFSFVEQEHSLV